MENLKTMVCACGGVNMRHTEVSVYFREEDGESECTCITKNHTAIQKNAAGNPSERREGIRIVLECETCDKLTSFIVLQHKGTTFFGVE